MEPRPKKLLDQACTELVEVSGMPCVSNITPFARNQKPRFHHGASLP
jgi:hypothetical protein